VVNFNLILMGFKFARRCDTLQDNDSTLFISYELP
jgi:hypothetical protein